MKVSRVTAILLVAAAASAVVGAAVIMFVRSEPPSGGVSAGACDDFAFIPCMRQTATISIPVAGSPFQLTYASDRVPGRKAEPSLDARALGLSGWSLDVLHAYDADRQTIVFGNGNRRAVEALQVTLEGRSALAVSSVEATEIYVFDDQGRHLQTRDGLTGAIRYRFKWDKTGLASVTEPPERNTEIVRDDAGAAVAIVSARGYVTRLGVKDDWLAAVVDPAGQLTRVTTGAGGLVTGIEMPNGAATALHYTDDGLLHRIEGPDESVLTLERSGYRNGYELKGTTTAGRGWSSRVTRDGSSTVREFTDIDGTVTRVEIEGNKRTIAAPDGATYRFELAADPVWPGAVVASFEAIGPSGRRWTGAASRTGGSLSRKLEPEGSSRSFTVGGATWKIAHDPRTSSTTSTAPDGRTEVTRFDQHGRALAIERQGFAPFTIEYDPQGRMSGTTEGTESTARRWRYESDPETRSVTITDPLGQKRTVSSDAAGRLVSLRSGDLQYLAERDATGQITAFTPPSGDSTRWAHRDDGRVAAVTYPGGSAGLRFAAYEYAPKNGDLSGVQFADERGVAIEHDAAGRVAAFDAGAGRWQIRYDANTGLPNLFESPSGQLKWHLDGAHIVRETWSGAVKGEILRELDSLGRVVADAVSGSSRVAYEYDGMGRLVRAGELTIARDPVSGLIASERLQGITRSWRYNEFGELTGTTVAAGGKPIYELQATRDALGRVTRRVERLAGGRERTETFTYDALNRLASVRVNGVDTTFTYDSNGNLVREARQGREVVAAYDNGDEILRRGETVFTSDAAGRLISATSPAGKTTFGFDRAGHLNSVSLPNGHKLEYVLDGLGRRIGRRVDGRVVNGYLYSDFLRPAAELDASGKVAARFVHALPSAAPTYVVRGGKTYLVVTNELGTPRLLLDASDGRIVEELDFDVWGRQAGTRSPLLPFGLAGGLVDPDTKLVHFGARDYDPQTARWTAPDPLGLAGGDSNMYRYTSGDPVNRIDLPGTCDVQTAGVTIGVGVGVEASVTFGVTLARGHTKLFFMPGAGYALPLPGGLSPTPTYSCYERVQPDAGGSSGPITSQGSQRQSASWLPGITVDREVLDTDGRRTLWGSRISVGPGATPGRRWLGTPRVGCLDCIQEVLELASPYIAPGPADEFFAYGVGQVATQLAETLRGALSNVVTSLPETVSGPTGQALAFIARIFGDPHLATADGITYPFMAVGEFTALRSNDDMIVQVRQAPMLNSRWLSINSAAAIGVHGDRVMVRHDSGVLQVRINGSEAVVHDRMDLPAGGFVTPEGRGVLVGWPDGSGVLMTPNPRGIDLTIAISAARIGTVRGLLGPYTGKSSKQLEARDGTRFTPQGYDLQGAQHEFYRAFGESWRVTADDSLFDYAAGESTERFTDRTFPDPWRPLPGNTTTAARRICAHAGVPDDALAACAIDVGATGEAGFAVTTAATTRATLPMLAFAAARGSASTSPPADSKPGSLLVRAQGSPLYQIVSGPAGTMTGFRSANEARDGLTPGTYTLGLNGTTRTVTIRSGEVTTLTSGTLVVENAGARESRLGVSEPSAGGSLLWASNPGRAGEPVALLAGDYVVSLNGSRQAITIREGQETRLKAGAVLVTSPGQNTYFIDDTSSRLVTMADTGTAVQLLAGTYTARLNGSRHQITVAGGETTALAAGTLVIRAGGGGPWFVIVYDEAGSTELLRRFYNGASDSVDLLPSRYVMDFDGTKQPFTIQPGKRVEMAVTGSGSQSTDPKGGGRFVFADGRISFVAPSGFTPLTKEEIAEDFSREALSRNVIGNKNRSTTIVYDLLEQRAPSEDLEAARRTFTSQFEATLDGLKWVANDVRTIAGRKWAYLEYSVRGGDEELRSVVLVGVYDGRILAFSFNSTEFAQLEKALRASMASISVAPGPGR